MLRVFVADGDPLSLGAILKTLRDCGHVATGTRHGSEAMLVSRQACDLILIDRRLDDMSGVELLTALSPDLRARCVLITRIGHSRERAAVTRLGAGGWLCEPLSAETLISCVARWDTSATTGLETHALKRWASLVVRSIGSADDVPTLERWARCLAVSKGALRNWCYTARQPPRDSLQFARGLRAVVLRERTNLTIENVLDMADRRTLVKFVRGAGGNAEVLPSTMSEYFKHQQFITDERAIEAVRVAMESENATTRPAPIAWTG